jgi:ABC-type molybdate transport system substrate-binding protein
LPGGGEGFLFVVDANQGYTVPEALAFLEYLKSETAAKLFADQGFTVLAEVPAQ